MDRSDAILFSEELEINGKSVKAILDSTGFLQWFSSSSSYSYVSCSSCSSACSSCSSYPRSYSSSDEITSLFLPSDVLGVSLGPSSLTIYSFQLEKQSRRSVLCCLGRRESEEKRVYREIVLQATSPSSLQAWHQAIISFIPSDRPRRLLIFLNPFGGKKLAKKIFQERVAPLLVAAGIDYTLKETQFRQHAKDLAKTMDLFGYDGIVCVSGDGILLEVLNGLLERGDWENAIKIPLGVIPAGTGNGMAKSLLHSVNEACNVENATFAIIQGYKQQLDVSTVAQGKTRSYSLLLLTWGLIADVDIESEKLRSLGSLRIDIYAMFRVLQLWKYSGTLAYIPAPGYEGSGESINADYAEVFVTESIIFPVSNNSDGSGIQEDIGYGYPGPASLPGDIAWRSIRGEFVLVWLMNVPWAAEDVHAAPSAKFADGFLDLIIVKDCPRAALLSLFLKLSDGSHVNSQYVEYLKVKAFRLCPGGRVDSGIQGGYINVDGEVLARGNGAYGDGSKDPMSYGPIIEVTVDKGLATMFSPQPRSSVRRDLYI